MPILVQQMLSRPQQLCPSLLIGFLAVSIEFGAQGHRKGAPLGPVDEPVEGCFEEAAVEAADLPGVAG